MLDDGRLIILLPEPLLSEWHGIHSDDYDRACAISNSWLNTISVPGGHGFLLGGDVGMILAIPSSNGVTSLIRWVYANDEEEFTRRQISDPIRPRSRFQQYVCKMGTV